MVADPGDDLSAAVGTGWLSKQGSDMVKGWKQRHFRLERRADVDGGWALAYFVDARPATERKGALCLEGARVKLPVAELDDGTSFEIVEAQEGERRSLRAASAASRARWVDLVTSIAEGRRGDSELARAWASPETRTAMDNALALVRSEAAASAEADAALIDELRARGEHAEQREAALMAALAQKDAALMLVAHRADAASSLMEAPAPAPEEMQGHEARVSTEASGNVRKGSNSGFGGAPTSGKLFRAIEKNKWDLAQWVLRSQPSLKSARREDEKSALTCAAETGSRDMVKLLLSYDAVVDAEEVFFHAARWHDDEMYRDLEARWGLEANMSTLQGSDNTPLDAALSGATPAAAQTAVSMARA